jgi:hypothetical protein
MAAEPVPAEPVVENKEMIKNSFTTNKSKFEPKVEPKGQSEPVQSKIPYARKRIKWNGGNLFP